MVLIPGETKACSPPRKGKENEKSKLSSLRELRTHTTNHETEPDTQQRNMEISELPCEWAIAEKIKGSAEPQSATNSNHRPMLHRGECAPYSISWWWCFFPIASAVTAAAVRSFPTENKQFLISTKVIQTNKNRRPRRIGRRERRGAKHHTRHADKIQQAHKHGRHGRKYAQVLTQKRVNQATAPFPQDTKNRHRTMT